MFKLHFVGLLGVLLALSACGGGGSGGSDASTAAEPASWDIYEHLAASAKKPDNIDDPILVFDFDNGSASDTDVKDLSGNGHHGTYDAYEDEEGSIITAGHRGNGILCSERGGIKVENNKNLENALNNDFAVSLWFQHTDIDYEGSVRLLSKKEDWDDKEGFEVEINVQDRRIRILAQNDEYISSLPIPLDYEWHHLVAQINGKTGSIYLDGVDFTWREDDRDKLSKSGIKKSDVDLYIGCHTSGYASFQGKIDNVKLFQKELSDDDVTTLYEGAAVSDNLLAHWSFESIEEGTNITQDNTANNLDAVVNNGVLEDGHPELGKALVFDGSTTNVDCAGEKALALTQQLTISAWVRVDDASADRYMRIVSKKSAYENLTGFEFEYNPQRQRLSFTGSGDKVARANGVDLGSGEWHMVTAVVDADRVTFYVDGTKVVRYHDELGNVLLTPRGDEKPYGHINLIQQKATKVVLGSTSPESADDEIGGYWIGAMDEVRIYDYPLTQDEIIDLIPAPSAAQ